MVIAFVWGYIFGINYHSTNYHKNTKQLFKNKSLWIVYDIRGTKTMKLKVNQQCKMNN